MIGPLRAFPGRGADGVAVLQGLALIPPIAAATSLNGVSVLWVFLASLAVVLAWDYAFATLRHRPLRLYGATTAAIFTLFVPVDIPIWHLVVALSIGTVIGEHVFGGRGFGFVSPATVALAIALLSLPNLSLVPPNPVVALACLPGAVLLGAVGVLSLPVAFAFLATLVLCSGSWTPSAVLGLVTACSVGAVFLVCDPLSSAVTGLGRVLYGVLAGGLAWVFAGFGTVAPPPDAIVFAALLASLLAPLIDTIVVALNGIWRRRRYG